MKQIPRPLVEGSIAVRDGRRLSYAEFGSARGEAIVWMHGTPGARRQVPLAVRRIAVEQGLRIIGVDRPGIGSSTSHLYRDVLDWTGDLEVLLNHLGVDSAHVVGLSGGGPYALAAPVGLPERIRGVAVMGGVAPTVGEDAAEGGPMALVLRLSPALNAVRRPLGFALSSTIRIARPLGSGALDLYAAFQPIGDKRLLGLPEFKAMFLDDLINGTRFQAQAPLADLLLFTRDWGFRLADVDSVVHWWHGDDDRIVPLRHGEHCAGRLSKVDFRVVEGESHLGGLGIADDVVVSLMEQML